MEFKEFTNPEEKDYDIKSGFNDEENKISADEKTQIAIELISLLGGFLEDEELESIYENYGITVSEYMNPTRETINKVKNKLEKSSSGRSR